MTPKVTNGNLQVQGDDGDASVGESKELAEIDKLDLRRICVRDLPNLDANETFRRMVHRLENSQRVVEFLQARGHFHLEKLLVQALDDVVGNGPLDAMLIVSSEGLVIAQSSAAERPEVLAAVCALFERWVHRAQSEQLVEMVEEVILRGFAGELLVARYLPGKESRLFLVAYAKRACSYRRLTTRALKLCVDLLLNAGHSLSTNPVPPPDSESNKPETKTN